MISRGGTDTPGPGESVSAIRFIGKFDFARKKQKKRNFENFWCFAGYEHFKKDANTTVARTLEKKVPYAQMLIVVKLLKLC